MTDTSTTPTGLPTDLALDAEDTNGELTIVLPSDLPAGAVLRFRLEGATHEPPFEVTLNHPMPAGSSLRIRMPDQARASGSAIAVPARRPAPTLSSRIAAMDARLAAMRIAPVVPAVAALGIAVIGQASFWTAKAATVVGVAAWLLATALFAVAWRAHVARVGRGAGERQMPERALAAPGLATRRRLGVAVVAGAAAAALGVLAVSMASTQPPLPSYLPAFVAWLSASTLIVVAASMAQVRPPRAQSLRAAMARDGAIILGVAGVAILALVLRVWNLDALPQALGGDEGEQGVEALKIMAGQIRNPFSLGWYSVPVMGFYYTVPAIALFGHTAFGVRIGWALVGVAAVIVLFLLARRSTGNTRLALLAALLLAAYHFHIHFSRLGSNQIADTLLVALAALFIVRGYQGGRWSDWALAGVVIGVGQYFYAGARFSMVLALALCAYYFARDGFRASRANVIGVGFMLAGLLIAGGPMLQIAITDPIQYNARLNMIGVFQGGWIWREMPFSNRTFEQIMVDQLFRAVLSFNAYHDRVFWYGLEGPLLDPASGVFFLLGFGFGTVASLTNRGLAPFVLWWWGAVLTGGMLTDTTPSSQRLVTAGAPAMFFVALAIDRLTVLAASAMRGSLSAIERRATVAGVLAAVTLCAISVRQYFVDYSPRSIYGGENALVATMVGRELAAKDERTTALFVAGEPVMFANIGTLRFLIPDVPKTDLKTLTAPLPKETVPPGSDAVFVFLPHRERELPFVRATFPSGTLRTVDDPRALGKPLFTMYTVDRALR